MSNALKAVKKVINQAGEFSLAHKRVLRNAFEKAFGTANPMGSGVTGYSDKVASSVERKGDLIVTTIFVDLDGMNSGGTAADIIGGAAAANCHIGQILSEVNGTIVGGRITCLELAAGGEPNIDLYAADEATGVEDTAVTALTNDVALMASSGDWIATGALTVQGLSAYPADRQHLYLVAGDATDATYTAGKLLIELYGV